MVYNLTGSEAFTESDVCKMLSEVAGHEVKYVQITPEQQKENFTKWGLSAFDIANYCGLDAIKAKGWAAAITPLVKDIAGHEPRKLRDWLKDHASDFSVKEEKKASAVPAAGKIMLLYHVPETRSTRPAHLVYELGLENHVDVHQVDWKYIKSNEYKKVDPNQRVPALSHDKLNLWESGAICDYLSRHAKEPLTPRDWTAQHHAIHQKIVFWCITTLDDKLISAAGGVKKLFSGATKQWWSSVVRPVLCEHLAGQDYINGKNFSLTDVYLAYSLYWANKIGLLKDAENKPIADYFARTISRPAFKKAFGDVKLNN
jgi:glutathione S-transferase